MINLSLDELKLLAKYRGIKDYENKSEDDLIKKLDETTKTSLSKKKIKGIRKDFNKLRDRFLKPKLKEIKRNLYEIENEKNLSKSEIKEIEKNFIELEESLFKLNKYYDYDIEYKGIRDVENLFNQSTEEDYYKPMKTKSAFNGNCIEHQSKGNKDKYLSPEEYFDMIRLYLSDTVNDHKTLKNLRVHSSNETHLENEKFI